ncbi:arginine/serine-rich coiled-coil protein 2-like isoform X3 [Mya arenaria]|uniref:arginine/serine-rich coiled-coil protein 2-like isoform X3 n=1 Tax=Mya arenaria TaxID=6604 RepID=UPI0022E088E0|nr:arginine/serine-rich coiled-coil protein 2-like isoform X3 [Mya arenaria]
MTALYPNDVYIHSGLYSICPLQSATITYNSNTCDNRDRIPRLELAHCLLPAASLGYDCVHTCTRSRSRDKHSSKSRDRRKHRSRSRDKRRKSRSRSGSKSKKSRKSRKSKSRSRSRSGGRSKSHEKRTSSRQSPSPEKSTVASKKENGHDEKGKSRERSMEKSREKSRKESRSISPADTKVHNVEKCEIDCGLTEQETKKRQKSEERNGVTKDGSDDNTGSKRKRKNLEVEMNEDSE